MWLNTTGVRITWKPEYTRPPGIPWYVYAVIQKTHTSWLNCYLCWWSLLLWRPPHFTKNAGYSEAAVGPHFWTWSHRHNYRHRIWPQVQTISPYQERIMLRVGSTRQLHQAARSVIWTCAQSWLAVRPHRGSQHRRYTSSIKNKVPCHLTALLALLFIFYDENELYPMISDAC